MDPKDRVLRDLGVPHLIDTLVDLAGADFTTLLLEVMRRRAAQLTAAEVLARYREDRFTAPGSVGLEALRAAGSVLLAAIGDEFEQVTLAPVVPTGSHAVMARVDQNNLLSTIRRTDAAGDPTVGLALEAAVRRTGILREEARSARQVHLASVQRVVRAQRFEGPVSFAHFTLLGLVSAGRDTGNHAFERESLTRHAASLGSALSAAGADEVIVQVTDWTGGRLGDLVAAITDRDARLTVVTDAERTRAHGYYQDAAFQIDAVFGDERLDVADGGLVDWTQRLVGSAKERMMISGVGVDRVAIGRLS